MVTNALAVCVTVIVMSVLLQKPLPKIPPWLDRMTSNSTCNEESTNVGITPENIGMTTGMSIGAAREGRTSQDRPSALLNNALLEQVSDIRKEVQCITKRLDGMKNDDELEQKWKQIANILNRIFLVIFLSVLAILLVYTTTRWCRPTSLDSISL